MLRRFHLKLVLYVLSAICSIVILLTLGVSYIQAVYLTTPVRNQNIGIPVGLSYQDITLTTADGLKISGWYIAGTRPDAIVLVHGIHANRTYLLPQARLLSEAGYHVLLIDLRGHGNSEGNLMTYGYSEALDVAATIDYALVLPEVEQIAVVGHSLGAAAAVRAAATDDRVKAIVIQSSYSSLSQAIDDSFEVFSIFPKWPFAPLIVSLAELRTGFEIGQVSSCYDLATMLPPPGFHYS